MSGFDRAPANARLKLRANDTDHLGVVGRLARGQAGGHLVVTRGARGRQIDVEQLAVDEAGAAPAVLDAEVDDGRIVRGQKERGAALMDRLEQLEQLDGALRIEVAGRLVAEKNRRLADDGAGDGDALLLAARKRCSARLAARAEADGVERGGGARADVARRQPEDL